MRNEISSGIIVFKKVEGNIHFLFLKRREGFLDFPKGHVEKGENNSQAARRETFEEAGIRCRIIPGFEERTKYYFNFNGENIRKDLIMFLGEVDGETPVKISNEHIGYEWLTYEQSISGLKYPNQRELITKAMEFINAMDEKEK
ncbi:MAG: NUDIX domain-containing protein [Candidatus Thermoplasmatota archaeon]|jgi:8-oxo-dGTP pyrophosphatase MutT (NUDIX family)|nr:NUDIX domain-containing protein [Candidatus Thermoplasmatota archaeon]